MKKNHASDHLRNLEIHLLVLRDAVDSALLELEYLKTKAPQSDQKVTDNIARHLAMLNSNKWRKKK